MASLIVHSASMPRSHIVLALKASCHACLITGENRHSEVPQSWQQEAMHFLLQWITSLPYENDDRTPFLHSHGIFANDQTHLQKQAEDRRAPPQHLLSPYLQGLSRELREEISSASPPILLNINLKGALKEQAAQATCAEKFCNDVQNHPIIIGTDSYTSMMTSDPYKKNCS